MATAPKTERIERGIERRHVSTCAFPDGKCTQSCLYRAEVYDRHTRRSARESLPTLKAARQWRTARMAEMASGRFRVLEPTRLDIAYGRWLQGVKTGIVRTTGGDDYKPSVIRAYESKFRLYILPKFGGIDTAELRTVHVQRLADELAAQGQSASTIRNTVMPLRALYRWLIRNELATINPCDHVALPSGEVARDTVTPPREALRRLELLQQDGRADWEVALWATAFFTGLRRGELLALDWENVDLGGAVLRVVAAFDPGIKELDQRDERANQQIVGWPAAGGGAFVRPKTKNGMRAVGIPRILMPYLARLDTTSGLLFTGTRRPAKVDVVHSNAKRVWEKAGLGSMTLHEARHTYASLMIAAGVDIVVVSRTMGHSNISITVDRYGHLLPDSVSAAAEKLDDLIVAAMTKVDELDA